MSDLPKSGGKMSGVEQARVGAELEPFVVESVDAEKMKIMAAILQDPNPIHFDVDAVRKLGLGDRPVNQGPINMAYLMNVATAWAGGPEALRRFQVRFAGNVFAGDTYSHTFNSAGTYAYHCAVHASMTGTIEVAP